MGVYTKYVLPRIIDLAMKNKDAAKVRAALIPQARGEVLEIGIGSGLNLPFYSPEVKHIFGVDPSLELQKMASKRVAGPIKVDFIAQSAEEPLPLEEASIDTVVMAWTLCSIPNPLRALVQLRRVLKPEGNLLFVEHGRAPDGKVAAWQDRLTPVWKHATGGCHLNRKVDDLITGAGFQITELTTSYLPGPRPMTYTYQGAARPA
jgi:ubiquinone/menaquinone biosynthesis C-methylase UbiE